MATCTRRTGPGSRTISASRRPRSRRSALAEAGVGQSRAPLVGSARLRVHAPGGLPLHLQARLPRPERARPRPLAPWLRRLRRLRREGDDRAAASVPEARAAARRRPALRRSDRGLVHERALALPPRYGLHRSRSHARKELADSGGRRPGGGYGRLPVGGLRLLPHAEGSRHERPGRPALDDADFETARAKVTEGSGLMPAFADQLTPEQIRDVAAFVASNAGSR
jgi:hypothetical protein